MPQANDDDRAGLRDFWSIYDRHYDEVQEDALRAARAHAEFGPILQAMSAAEMAANAQRSRENLREAIAGRWDEYDANLRSQGAAYARMGVTFAGWYDIVGAFQRRIIPLLVGELVGAPERLAAALGAMQQFLDRAMVTIADSYLSTKEALIVEQREAVRHSEEVLDYLLDGVAVYDRDGRYVSFNPAMEQIIGQPLSALAGRVVWEAFPDALDGDFCRAFHRVVSSGKSERFETYSPARGRWFDVQVYAVRKGILSISRDITESHLEAQSGRFFTLSLDLLCIADVNGYFKRLNPAFAVLGYSDEELRSRPFLDFVHPDDQAATLAEIEKLARGEPTISFENRYRCKDGSYRDLIWAAAPDPDQMIYAAAHDVTDRKRVERERAALNKALTARNEALMHADNAKSDFLAMMSHELRTPLNSIIGFSELLLDKKFGALTDKQSRYVDNVHQSGRHLLGLINDLLDISKIEAGRLEVVGEPCSARALAADAAATLQPAAASRDVRLTVEVTAQTVPPVAADAVRFKQVLYNLLSNAIKFSRPGGVVTVTCELSPVAGYVRTTVSDTGAGIAPSDLATLFTPFTQLANAREQGGTGLGLALSKRLVELMGGTIGVESTIDAGSRFFVDLPIDTVRPPVSAANADVHVDATCVLIVDDDPAAQELLVTMLQDGGYRTLVASTGEDALATARRERPDVITLDVFLPTIDGWDVLRILQSDPATASIPVVMVTIASDRRLAFTLGAVEHLVKPIQRDALLETLARRSFTTKVKAAPVRVLVVDDDPNQLELVRATLEPHGFVVHTESTGRGGVATALTGRFDLLLLDLVLPDISGVEVVSELKRDARTQDLPILLITGHTLDPDARARLNGAVVAVIAKGSREAQDLLGEIAQVIRRDR